MLFSKNYSEILLATRLKLFNLMMLISFALISAIIMYSLYNVEKMVTGSMQHHLEQIVRNSQMTRELSKTFADIRLLAHLFYGKDDYLAIEGKNVLSQLQEIQPKITDVKALESFQALKQQFKAFLHDCSGLNKTFAESKAVNQEILSDLDWFDNTITEFIIKLTIEGKDISEMETLSDMAISYRERILRIGKACEQHEKEALNNVSDNKEPWILKNLNTMDLQTQYFVNYKYPVFAYIGKKLQKNITAYRNIILGLSRNIRKHDIMVSDLENSIVQYQTVMDNSDKRNVDESDSIRRNVKEMIDNSRLTILIIPLLILIGLSYITNMLIRFHIRRPMETILQGIAAFHSKNFKSRIRMNRKDEWDEIEKAFNSVADELIHSYSALHASEKKYRSIFENAPLGIFQCTFNGDFMNVNPEMASILGYQNSEDLLNTWKDKKLWQSVSPEDMENIRKELEEKSIINNYPMSIIKKNNDHIWVILNAIKISEKNGEVAYVDGMITDITDRKLARDALQQLRNYLNNIIDSMPSVLLGIDSDRRITQWNKEAEKVTGVSKEAALGQRFTDVLPQLNHETERIYLATRNQQVQKNSKVNMTFNEKTDFFDITTYPLTDDGIGLAVIRLDNVTEQVQMEKMLIQSEKMLSIGRLSAGIAHDFNNILTGIIGYTDLIRFFDLPKDSPVHSHLEVILISANRARDLVQQILTFSRQAKQEKVFLSLELILKETARLIRASLPSTIKIDQNIEKINSTVLADSTQMHQVIMNLCTNAADAMKEDGGILEITLSKETVHEERKEKDIQSPGPDGRVHKLGDSPLEGVRGVLFAFGQTVMPAENTPPQGGNIQWFPQAVDTPGPGDYICLTVSDTGHGIPPEIIEQIYDPFFTTKRQGEGTGMGLSVVHGIVEAHNGVVKADSQPGKGSRFRVYLPAFEKNAKLETREDITTLPKGNERIIFADDEKHIVIFAEQVFKNLGYTFTGFTDSKKALEAFKRTPHWFDILITDLTMPGMTGTRLSREIYQIRPDIPIILCSGSADIDTEKDIESYCRFIRKPLSARLLAQSARKALTSSE
ncbi:MAG: PAS domain S-box protein [Desulfobacteraceae bacterium]|nr:PAS domain S-box protein [Desulfobacteraceae bacterium]